MPEQTRDEKLYQIASQQAGYFTPTQARVAGFSQRQLSYYVNTGHWTRIRRGIYRLQFFPDSSHEDLFVAWLQAGESAVISHESALVLYELSDVLPHEIHLIIPRTTSRRYKNLRLHTNQLAPEDVSRFSGLPVTTVLRTIADVASAGLAEELVIQAIRQALLRGLVTRESFLRDAERRGGRTLELARRALEERRR